MVRTPLSLILATLLLLTGSGCLFRSHKVQSRLSNAPLLSATSAQLIDRVNAESAHIRTMNATVDIATSVGGQKKGKVTDYSEIRGYILAEKPAMLRMIGLLPIVRNRAFDMVSDGQNFKLWIPPKNRFITGANEVTTPSANPLENLRPQVIYDALLLREIDPKSEIAVVEAGTQVVRDPKNANKTLDQDNYKLDVIRKDSNGQWYLSRKIYFDRVDLAPYRQVIFDRRGNIATDASYSDFQNYENVSFPSHIEIVRPQEEYTIGLKIVSLKLNTNFKPDQFELAQPAGAEVKVLGNTNASAAANQPQANTSK
jgi:outer membrane lipoprotein-sorting protein